MIILFGLKFFQNCRLEFRSFRISVISAMARNTQFPSRHSSGIFSQYLTADSYENWNKLGVKCLVPGDWLMVNMSNCNEMDKHFFRRSSDFSRLFSPWKLFHCKYWSFHSTENLFYNIERIFCIFNVGILACVNNQRVGCFGVMSDFLCTTKLQNWRDCIKFYVNNKISCWDIRTILQVTRSNSSSMIAQFTNSIKSWKTDVNMWKIDESYRIVFQECLPLVATVSIQYFWNF